LDEPKKLRPLRNPGVQEKVEVVEQVLTIKFWAGPRRLGETQGSRDSRTTHMFGGREELLHPGEG